MMGTATAAGADAMSPASNAVVMRAVVTGRGSFDDRLRIEGPSQDERYGASFAEGTASSQPGRKSERSEDREIAVGLVRGHVRLVAVPLLALVADQELVDVLAERVTQHGGVGGQPDRFVQVLRQ